MSMYTNDIDTLRQMISQSMPQFLNSLITVISVFISMLILSVPLTAVTCVMVAVTLFVSGKVAGQSGRFFVKQQRDIGTVNGYIEEMMAGQKVVKVFNPVRQCQQGEQIREYSRTYKRAARQSELCYMRGRRRRAHGLRAQHDGRQTCVVPHF